MEFPLPELSDSTQAFVRIAYGALQCANLLLYLPHARRFFVSERWRGYAQSSPGVDAIQNPWVMPVVLSLWMASAVGIFWDRWTIAALSVNLALCWYYFVWGRWRGVLRGSGAPGLMNYWLAAAVFCTEIAHRLFPGLHSLAVFVFQAELAIILFTSGFYKFRAGFLRNEGMDYGLVNPQWGIWWQWYRRLSPRHWIFKIYNQCAWFGQILSAVLMLIPGLRWVGGLLLIGSFVVIQANIRLAFLSLMMMLCGVLFFDSGTTAEKILSQGHGVLSFALQSGLLFYLAMLPVVYGGLFFNFYARKSLPTPLQKAVDRYASFFGMILWRVFTVDLTDFYVQIYCAGRADPDRRILLSRWGSWACPRFRHVAESITVTTLFTTLKYYPTQPKLFQERLLRYARTLPCGQEEVLIFAYVRILKKEDLYADETAQEFLVDTHRGEVRMLRTIPDDSIFRPGEFSPIHEASGPGSYKPAHP